MRAETALNDRGELERPGFANYIESAAGSASVRDQQINYEAISQERARRGESIGVSDRLNSMSNKATDETLKEMKMQTDILRDQTKALRDLKPSSPAMTVSPPMPAGRM